MNGYLQMSNKTLASKHITLYTITDGLYARTNHSPWLAEAEASACHGFFFLSRLVVQATEGRKELGNIKYSITH